MNRLKYLIWMSLLVHPVFAQELVSVVPDSARQEQTLTVSITGQNTMFGTGSPSVDVWFSQGSSTIHATSVAVQSNTLLDADFSFAADAPLGLWDVNAEQIDDLGVVTLADGFTINSPPVTRYVATDGSDDGNDCTDPLIPCATLAHVVNQANDGDIIDLADGAYSASGLVIEKNLIIQGQGVVVL